MRLLYVTALFVLTLGLTSCDDDGGNALAQELGHPPDRLDGSFSVFYRVRTSDTSVSGSTLNDVTTLRFYERYVVAETKNGGQVFPMRLLVELKWTRKQ